MNTPYTNCNYYKADTRACFAQKCAPRTNCSGNPQFCELERSPETYDSPYTVFTKNLVPALKEYIKDYIKTYVKDDTLIVEFYHNGKLSTVFVESSILSKIEHNLTSTELAERIYRWYKKVILTRYFNK